MKTVYLGTIIKLYNLLFLFNKIKEAAFPAVCIFCGSPIECSNSLCPKCWLSVKFINKNTCKYCGGAIDENQQKKYHPTTSLQCCVECFEAIGDHTNYSELSDFVAASIIYDDFIKPYILKFKNGNHIQLAIFFAKLFHEEDFLGADLIVPVPIHLRKLFKRTYNQAALLAFSLKKLRKSLPPVNLNIIKKVRYTGSQKGKSSEERKQNIIDSFSITDSGAKFVAGKVVVLLDDVVASGATLMECKKILETAGAKEVRCVTLARSI
jgi:ComF family protein